jgi:hypothetical protein
MNLLTNFEPAVNVALGLITFASIFNIMQFHHSKINIILGVGSMVFINLGCMYLIIADKNWEYMIKTSAFNCFIGICFAYLVIFLTEKLTAEKEVSMT